MTRVAVLAGGYSPEREVSLRSGHRVDQALRHLGHDSYVIDPAETPLVEALSERAPEAVYIALHGKDGEDGTVQRLLGVLSIPYTGTGPFACQMTFDKVLSKEILESAGVRVPRWAAVQASALRDLSAGAALGAVAEHVGLPCVVKPSRGGSAMGLSYVEREPDLPAAIMSALSFSDSVVVEAKVEGSEVAAGIAGSPAEPLPLVEIVPKSGVFDYAARYTAGATDYFAPARLSSEISTACAQEALKAFEALGMRDVGRIDLIVDPGGTPFVLEADASPGMTETSLLPMAAQAAGVTLGDLCDRVLRLARTRA